MTHRPSASAALIGLLFLAACSATPESGSADADVGGPAAAANPDQSAAITPTLGPPKTAAGPLRSEKLTALTPPGPPSPAVPQPPSDIRNRLMGMTAAGVRNLLGAPNFVRRDPPAAIWQYRMTECVVDLFLYDDAKRQVVRHVETRVRSVTAVPRNVCFDELLRRHRSPTPS